MTRVVITGMGMVTPLGVGLRRNWQGVLSSASGVVSTTTFSDYNKGWDQVPAKVMGRVPRGPLSDGKWDPKDHFDAAESKRLGTFAQFALAATNEALQDSGLDLSALDATRVGVAVGSGVGSFDDVVETAVTFEKLGYRRVSPLFVPRFLINMAAGNISIKYGTKGPLHTASTACATGVHSIGDAYNFIVNGYADVMIAGATEAISHPLGLAGFARARSLCTDFNDEPTKASRPFDRDRAGFVLGEGSGILTLEKLDDVIARGAEDQIYAEIVGYGVLLDSHHITAPHETGEGAFRAMKMAVDRAGVDPNQVDYVNAHATSTMLGDRAENNAIHLLFGQNNDLSVSSSKSAIGHLLGAAGAVESIYTIKGIKEGVVPPTLNLDNIGGNKDDDGSKFVFDYVPHTPREKDVKYAVVNSFGFGGINGSLLFAKYNK